MKQRQPGTDRETYSDVERRWLADARSKPKMSSGGTTLFLVIVLVALVAAAYLFRARIGALWQQVTGKAPPLWVMPEKPEHEGPDIEGRDF